MSGPVNYDSVVEQLTSFGLLPLFPLEVGKRVRCYVQDDREKRGWYHLHEFRRDDGTELIVGSYGMWRANDSNKQKIVLDKSLDLSAEQRQALKIRMAEDSRRAAAAEKQRQAKASDQAGKMWSRLSEEGECAYLQRKRVAGHGVRYTPQGNMALPLLDGSGKIWGLQIIYGQKDGKKGRDKDFWPAGLAKKAHWFQIGSPDWVILVAEGYATGASLHEATGYPVAVAFDAGNLLPVSAALHKKYPRAQILICADDDYRTAGNPGISAAQAAAVATNGAWLAPTFAAERPTDTKGPTDFNDLHVLEGLHVVRTQLEAKLTALGWKPKAPVAPAGAPAQGGGGAALAPITDPYALNDRYTLVYGGGDTVFDHDHHMLVTLGEVRNLCTDKNFVRRWQENPARKVAFLRNVGFDPAGTDPNITCNIWAGWPTTPKKGQCDLLLDLLMYLTGEEDNNREVYEWVLKWLAYPIQHPGAKMKTALVMHGPQGAGKNQFFEAVMAIYGQYGRIVDQMAIEDKFNDWASGKLFLIADEVVARQELFHVKNKLKHFVTGDWIRINPKNVAAHDEKNHVNLVFLSNETQPLVLERDDRRYCVVWTPAKLDADFYRAVADEIAGGGIAALHDYLLNLDLGDFNEHSKPPVTKAKTELIEVSFNSTERFILDWLNGRLEGVPALPCRSESLYGLYKTWCQRNGHLRFAPSNAFLGDIGKRPDLRKAVERYEASAGIKQATFITPLSAEMPEGRSKPAWLASCADQFDRGVGTWKSSFFHSGDDQ